MSDAVADRPPAVRGLDTLRLVAAAWVALAHGARAPLAEIAAIHPGWSLPAALNNALFNGVAAVMMFFVVSGFVIHLPQARGRSLDVAEHYARRLVRIVPPVLAAQCVVWLAGDAVAGQFRNILWSIWCEVAYYIAYPVLLPLFRRIGTRTVFAATTAVALALIAATWPTPYYSELPLVPLVLIGLPSWILGCLLAERLVADEIRPAGDIWAWRFGAVVLSALMKIPVTHGPIHLGFPSDHWIFAIYCYLWIGNEIARFAKVPPPEILEAGGRASYSLYLVHFCVIIPFGVWIASIVAAGGSGAATIGSVALLWVAELAAIAAATAVFHIVVERPSHRLARHLGRLLHAARVEHRSTPEPLRGGDLPTAT